MKKVFIFMVAMLMISIYSMSIDEINDCIANWNNNDSMTKVIKYFGNKKTYTDEEYGL